MHRVNLDSVKIGNKYSTEQKLLTDVGFEKHKSSDSKKAQIKELQRYVSWERTNRINPKTKRASTEIIITNIYITPKDKVDGRIGKGNSTNTGKYRKYLLPLLQQISLQEKSNEYYGGYSIYVLCNQNNLGITNSASYIKPVYEETKYSDADEESVITYKNYMKRIIKNSVFSTLKYMKKTYKGFYYQLTWSCDGDIADEEQATEIYKILKECQDEAATEFKINKFSLIFSKSVNPEIRKLILSSSYEKFLKAVYDKFEYEKMQEVFIIQGAEAEYKNEVYDLSDVDDYEKYTNDAKELRDCYKQTSFKYIEKNNDMDDLEAVKYAHNMLFNGYNDIVIGNTFDISDFVEDNDIDMSTGEIIEDKTDKCVESTNVDMMNSLCDSA